jgi:hypothetical protein
MGLALRSWRDAITARQGNTPIPGIKPAQEISVEPLIQSHMAGESGEQPGGVKGSAEVTESLTIVEGKAGESQMSWSWQEVDDRNRTSAESTTSIYCAT